MESSYVRMDVPEKILIRAPNWIGDHVMAIPFYRGLRKAFPKSHLTLVARENLRDFPFSEFDETKWISRQSFPFGAWKAGKNMGGNYDLAITLPASFSASLFLLATKSRRRIGFSQGGSQLFLTDSIPWVGRTEGTHKSEQYLSLLKWMTGKEFNEKSLPLFDWHPEKSIVISPGASISLREWPYAVELIASLREKYSSHRIAVVGSKQDEKWRPLIQRAQIPQVDIRIGETTLLELLDIFKKAELVIANDSGSAHLAGAVVGARTLVLLGPGDPAYIGPLGPRVELLRVEELRCSPCESAHCAAPYGYQECLRTLPLQSVLTCADLFLSSN